jgi:2-dehydro-3-deoxyphosphooctonate aldolase (KDO 8-P synthase)
MNDLILMAGPCAIEDDQTPYIVLEHIQKICKDYNIKYIFKSSWKKANRTSLNSFSGIDQDKALSILHDIKSKYNISIVTDIHETTDAAICAEFADYLQIPAFLCRQTDLLLAAGNTGCHVNIKKGQFVSPESMKFAVQKVKSTGNDKVLLTERGAMFGYERLVVDFTGISTMQESNVPVIVDCTHSLQRPNQASGVTGGDPKMIGVMANAAMAVGADGLFMEVHPDPSKAFSDASTMLKLDKFEEVIEKAIRIRKAAL